MAVSGMVKGLRKPDAAAPGGGMVASLGLTLAGAVAVRTVLTATTHARAARRQALRHAQTARLVGQPQRTLQAVVVEHAQPAAYCVAGRQPTVIHNPRLLATALLVLATAASPASALAAGATDSVQRIHRLPGSHWGGHDGSCSAPRSRRSR